MIMYKYDKQVLHCLEVTRLPDDPSANPWIFAGISQLPLQNKHLILRILHDRLFADKNPTLRSKIETID